MKVGMCLRGLVRNVVFGVFVDVGVKFTGTVHRSVLGGHKLRVNDFVDV